MKNLTFAGLLLLVLAFILYYSMPQFSSRDVLEPRFLIGLLSGVGFGLLFGGIVGYISKGNSIKADLKKKELKQLQKEKLELEKQTAEQAKLLEKQNSNQNL